MIMMRSLLNKAMMSTSQRAFATAAAAASKTPLVIPVELVSDTL